MTLPLKFNYPPAVLRRIGYAAGDRPHLSDHVLKTLQQLGISKIRPRGKKSGVKRKSDYSIPIRTVVNYRSREGMERGLLNQNNIVTIKTKQLWKSKLVF